MSHEKETDAGLKSSVLTQLKSSLNQRRQIDDEELVKPLAENDPADVIDTGNVSHIGILPNKKQPVEVSALDTERTRLDNVDFEAEILLKKAYGKYFLIILATQLLIMNIVFISVGFEWIKFPDTLTLQLYMGGTMTEVFGLVLVVTKYLFKKR
ncbi:MAG: hypothetical protein ACRDBF_07345 [Plesiomonas shigelloides]